MFDLLISEKISFYKLIVIVFCDIMNANESIEKKGEKYVKCRNCSMGAG